MATSLAKLTKGMALKMLYDVPLFPLGVVLFPEMNLPLRIFEPRYRQMITDCIESGSPFGVVLIREGEEVKSDLATKSGIVPYRVGTLAKITQVVKLDDGDLLITAVGADRFYLKEYREDKAYLTGDVEIYPDGAVQADNSEIQNLVFNISQTFESYFEVLQELANRKIDKIEIPGDPAVLSYFIPHWLRISLAEKQNLLEIPAPRERLLEEHVLLSRETDSLKKLKDAIDQEVQEANRDNPSKAVNPNSIVSRFSRN